MASIGLPEISVATPASPPVNGNNRPYPQTNHQRQAEERERATPLNGEPGPSSLPMPARRDATACQTLKFGWLMVRLLTSGR